MARLAESVARRGVIDWTELRGFDDWVELHPEYAQLAIAETPPSTGDAVIDNLLAAIAEIVADLDEAPRPAWTAQVQPLTEPWWPPGTPMMHARASREAPEQFLARNLHMSANAVWHGGRRTLLFLARAASAN